MATQFIPALRYNWLTRWYDFIISATFPEKRIKQALIDQLNLKNRADLLDFGIGTGTLSLMLKQQFPKLHIIGIDVDKKILELAQSWQINRAKTEQWITPSIWRKFI